MKTNTKSSTFRILFLLRKSKSNKQGLSTITIRITIDGEAIEFSSKYKGVCIIMELKSRAHEW